MSYIKLSWINGEARSSLGNLYEVASLGGSVWQVRWNGTAFTGWHSTQEGAIDEAERHHMAALASQRPYHHGDPCVKCGVPHDEVGIGPCPSPAYHLNQ